MMNNYLELEFATSPAALAPNLMQGILEGLTDGVLILTTEGEWIYHNYYAHCICQTLNAEQPTLTRVPDAIWRVCSALMASAELYGDRPVVIESEVRLSKAQVYRIRARWLVLDDCQRPYLMVVLEDRSEAVQNQALAEAILYDLTPRQTEVWLLYRAGFSYQEIATELYITLNTVKRHLKDVRIKQQEVATDMDEMSDYVNAVGLMF